MSVTYPDRTSYAAAAADPVIAPGQSWDSVDHDVTEVAFGHEGGLRWWIAFVVAIGLVGLLVLSLGYVLYEGVGVWGNNVPVTWALDIVGYDWWIGVACGGLMVSALMLLLRLETRSAINRITETMALISACAAGIYPIVHLGRPWFFYWNLPYPNTFMLWPQFRSPLYWDAIDIFGFLGICASFWFTGLVPDLAAMRDRAVERVERYQSRPGNWTRVLKAQCYGIAALGWRGSTVHWHRWMQAYRALAVFGILLVVSLQTGAAVMFAGSVEPGWHDVLAPVAFLFAALLAGVAMIGMLLVVLRSVFPLRGLITVRHLDLLALLMLGFAWANLYCYAAEFLTTTLTGDSFSKASLGRQFVGPNAWSTWSVLACSLIPPNLFWFRPLRRSATAVFVVGLLAAFGTWSDHFMIIVLTLQHDFLPSAAHSYTVGIIGVTTFLGTVGLFLTLLLLAMRYLPVVSMVGLRGLIPSSQVVRRG